MVDAIQGLGFSLPGISSFELSKKKPSDEHLAVIQQLISLGIVPSYDYEKDLDKLGEALAAMIENEALAAQEEADEEAKTADLSSTEQSQNLANSYIPFSSELNQSAIMNKFLFNL